jgi:putative transcriptional regulator
VRAVREQTKRSQTDFAAPIGVNLKTLQNWKQGWRKPQGPARALLKIVAATPKSAMRALHA